MDKKFHSGTGAPERDQSLCNIKIHGHIRGDNYEVGEVITLILNKEGVSVAIYMVCRGGLTEILIFPTDIFPSPTPRLVDYA